MNRLLAYIDEHVPRINQALEQILPRGELIPATLHEAMRYSVTGGGKRIRPLLCIMSAEVCGGGEEAAMPAACAVELIHAYSLVHDDLPVMDNDMMRRGKLTCHRAFGEATAVLAGDGLLTLAFEVLATRYPPEVGAPACAALARAAGHLGMVGGQQLDLEGEGTDLGLEQIEAIDRRKTGALIGAACRLGGLAAGGSDEQLGQLERYGHALGLAFQVVDDILDIEGDPEEMGKGTGKDSQVGKLTYPSTVGIPQALTLAREQIAEAKECVKGFDKEALMLRLMTDFVLERRS